jgi:hypothetical protein
MPILWPGGVVHLGVDRWSGGVGAQRIMRCLLSMHSIGAVPQTMPPGAAGALADGKTMRVRLAHDL